MKRAIAIALVFLILVVGCTTIPEETPVVEEEAEESSDTSVKEIVIEEEPKTSEEGVTKDVAGSQDRGKEPRTTDCTIKDPSLAENRVAVAAYRAEEDTEISFYVGRGEYFAIYDDGNYVETIENPYADMDTSPGESVANMLAEKGITAIVGGDMGPQITELFNERGIKTLRTCGEVTYFSELIS